MPLTVGIQLVAATPAGFVGPKKMSIEPSLFLTVFSKPFFDDINCGVSGIVPSVKSVDATEKVK